jgi:hypothetical protein
MKQNKNNIKKLYVKPLLTIIKIDKEISLIMVSNPPGDPESAPGRKQEPKPFESPFK